MRNKNFLGLSESESPNIKSARVVILPVPYERTSSYKHGSKNAPAEIISASCQVELYDEELALDPAKIGIHTLKPQKFYGASESVALEKIYSCAKSILREKKFLVSIGGEHTISFPILRAFKEFFKNFTVLHFDAHADLRSEYGGTPFSHASAMRRAADDLSLDVVSVGIRNISAEEAKYAKKRKQKIFYAKDFRRKIPIDKIISSCKKNVYLTIDADVFDSGVLPCVGTPEPGGLGWYDALDIVRAVCQKRTVIGMDFVELCPIPNYHAGNFFIAKLIYKLIGYAFFATRKF